MAEVLARRAVVIWVLTIIGAVCAATSATFAVATAIRLRRNRPSPFYRSDTSDIGD